jgi:transposase-like protein
MKKRGPNSSAQRAKFVRRKYDDEFKLQALQMIRNGQSVVSVTAALGVREICSINGSERRGPINQQLN